MVACGCFGHRESFKNYEKEMMTTLENLILENDNVVFMTGGMGQIDNLFSSTVRSLKRKYKNLRLLLVVPYLTNDLNKNKDYYVAMYDEIIVPDELIGVHYKTAIKQRNRWIVEHCDVIIDCTYRDFGGAYTAIQYAKKAGKKVIKL